MPKVMVKGVKNILGFPDDMPLDDIRKFLSKKFAPAAAVGGLSVADEEEAKAGVITKAGKKIIEAWHGTPHSFEKFDISKIGTGEGAQAYGHGLYAADRRKIAESYRDTLTQQRIGADVGITGTIDRLLSSTGTTDEGILRATKELKNRHQSALKNPDYDGRFGKAVDMLDAGYGKQSQGSLYRLEIEASPDELIDWDKPLSEQPHTVKEIAKKHGFTELKDVTEPWKNEYLKGVSSDMKKEVSGAIDEILYGDEMSTFAWNKINQSKAISKSGLDPNDMHDMRAMNREPTGEDIYNKIAEKWQPYSYDAEIQKLASESLNRQGIKGIQYSDITSRFDDQGSKNYVIFDDKLMSIAKKYGIAPGAAISAIIAGEKETQASELSLQQWVEAQESPTFGQEPRPESQAIPIPESRQDLHAVGMWLKQNLDFPLGGTWLEGLGDYMTDLSEGQKKSTVDKYISGLWATLDLVP